MCCAPDDGRNIEQRRQDDDRHGFAAPSLRFGQSRRGSVLRPSSGRPYIGPVIAGTGQAMAKSIHHAPRRPAAVFAALISLFLLPPRDLFEPAQFSLTFLSLRRHFSGETRRAIVNVNARSSSQRAPSSAQTCMSSAVRWAARSPQTASQMRCSTGSRISPELS